MKTGFWKDLLWKIFFYDWDKREIVDYIKSQNKLGEFTKMLKMLYRAHIGSQKGILHKVLDKKELKIMTDNPQLWLLADFFEEKGLFKVFESKK